MCYFVTSKQNSGRQVTGTLGKQTGEKYTAQTCQRGMGEKLVKTHMRKWKTNIYISTGMVDQMLKF